MSSRDRAGELGMGRAGNSLDDEFPPRSGGRSPRREDLLVGRTRGGPWMKWLLLLLLLLNLIISKRILLLSPLDRVTPFWLGCRAHLASFHSYFQRKPRPAGLRSFVVVTPAAHLLPQKRSKNNWKYVYSAFQGPPPYGAAALLHPNHSRRNT